MGNLRTRSGVRRATAQLVWLVRAPGGIVHRSCCTMVASGNLPGPAGRG